MTTALGFIRFSAARPSQEGERPLWLTTFADLVALLVAFFVLLYSVSVIDPSAWDKIKGDGVRGVPLSQQGIRARPAVGAETSAVLDLGYLKAVFDQHRADPRQAAGAALRATQVVLRDDVLRLEVPVSAIDPGDAAAADRTAAFAASVAAVLAYTGNRIAVSHEAVSGDAGVDWAEGLGRARSMADALQRAGIAAPLDIEASAIDGTGDADRLVIQIFGADGAGGLS